MFCPSCGRDASLETKFCASCGTNLEVVSRALTGTRDDFFTKIDSGLDQLIARYAEHVFRNAPARIDEGRVGDSWKVLGQGVITTFVDLILFSLMWNVLPLRFLILMISTPFRLLSQRSTRGAGPRVRIAENTGPVLASDDPPRRWLAGEVPAVSEHTTQHLGKRREAERTGSARE
ncbi:MAG TPA: zinc ribbon domain-containing protein [Blastocatellia bacterium]|nr:zinc ribbon domain-containing protein [Blastocatellia bacterium]